MNVGRSIELGSTVIVVLSFSRAFAGLLKDHAVAVAMSGRHAQDGPVVHHARGLSYRLHRLLRAHTVSIGVDGVLIAVFQTRTGLEVGRLDKVEDWQRPE